MKNNIKKNLEERKKELLKRINYAKKQKHIVEDKVQEVLFKLTEREITHAEYEKELSNFLGDKTGREWEEYYDNYISHCEKLLQDCERKYTVVEVKNLSFKLAFVFLMFGVILFFQLHFNITGFVVDLGENSTEDITTHELFTNESNFSYGSQEETNFSLSSPVDFSITQHREEIIVNQPVQWTKEISSKKEGIAVIDIPEGSTNLKVFVSGAEITETIRVSDNKAEIEIADAKERYELRYETAGPAVFEEGISKGRKKVFVSAPDNLNYTNVTTFTTVEEIVRSENKDSIQLYWLVDGERISHSFSAADTDSDGFIDYLEWVTPHLSEQVFEIILITKAEHLDKNRNFVSDIYEQVKELDEIWSEEISNQEYVRVVFERNLTSSKDITIFPRVVQGNPKIEIYEIDQEEPVAEFSSLVSEEYNKIYLTNLAGEQDTFDLKVIGGSVAFDHIVDPVPSLEIKYYNFSGISNPSSTHTARWASPAGRNIFLAGTEASSEQYTNLSTRNAQTSNVIADGSNDEPFWRFTFNITESESSVSWIFVEFTGYENAAETATAYVYNYSSNGLVSIGTVPGSNGNLTLNLTDAANFINGTSNNFVVYVEGANYDSPSDTVFVDFVQLRVAYTPADTLPPLVTINLPVATTLIPPILFNVTLDENGNACNYTLNSGVNNVTMQNNGNRDFNATNTSIADGSYTVRYYCWDSSNVLNSTTTRNFSVDQTPPLVTINSPLSNLSVPSVIFNVTTNENSSAQYSLNSGVNNVTMQNNGNRDFNATNTSIADGSYTAIFYVNDSVGNFNRTTSISFIVDTVDPLISYGIGTELSGANVSRNWTYVNVSFTETNFKNITFVLKNDSGVVNSTTFTAAVYTINWTNLAFGNYSYNVSIFGAVGRFNSTENRIINLSSASNAAPQITSVTSIPNVDPTEDSFVDIVFNFTAFDSNGANDLQTTGIANFSRSGDTLRQNSSCIQVNTFATNYANYSCTIKMWYFDGSGNWNVSVFINDSVGESAVNLTTIFQYNQLQAIKISPNQFSFNANIGGTNQTPSDDPTLINNTGNYNVANISVTAIDLFGSTYNTFFIGAANFSVDIDTGGSPPAECNGAGLVNGTAVNVTGAILNRGNHSINDGSTGQEQIYYCLREVPSTLPSQTYSTTSAGAWRITILAAAFAVGYRKKKKRGALTEESTLEILEKKIEEKYDVSLKELISHYDEKVKQKDIEIPLDLFRENIGAAEILCKFLKENKGLKLSEIARLLKRDQRTVGLNYRNAVKKKKEIIAVEGKNFVPLKIFSNRRFSILESAVYYLREKGFKNAEMAEVLHKDPRNIWTLYSRALRKVSFEKKNV